MDNAVLLPSDTQEGSGLYIPAVPELYECDAGIYVKLLHQDLSELAGWQDLPGRDAEGFVKIPATEFDSRYFCADPGSVISDLVRARGTDNALTLVIRTPGDHLLRYQLLVEGEPHLSSGPALSTAAVSRMPQSQSLTLRETESVGGAERDTEGQTAQLAAYSGSAGGYVIDAQQEGIAAAGSAGAAHGKESVQIAAVQEEDPARGAGTRLQGAELSGPLRAQNSPRVRVTAVPGEQAMSSPGRRGWLGCLLQRRNYLFAFGMLTAAGAVLWLSFGLWRGSDAAQQQLAGENSGGHCALSAQPDANILRSCIEQSADDRLMLQLAREALAGGRCELGLRIMFSRGRSGLGEASFYLAQAYDERSGTTLECLDKNREAAIYWYEKARQSAALKNKARAALEVLMR